MEAVPFVIEVDVGSWNRPATFDELRREAVSPQPTMSSEASTSTALPRNDFFQSDENFTVSVYVRNLQPQDVTVAFRERAVSVLLSVSLPARSSSDGTSLEAHLAQDHGPRRDLRRLAPLPCHRHRPLDLPCLQGQARAHPAQEGCRHQVE